MKKLVSILLTVVLMMGLMVPSAAAADKATGTTLRLESTEGTVSITNASGIDRKYTKGMKLYSGNTLETELNSYAYVSLDSSKVVKLGSLSQAEVSKSGKKLELKLTSGELFFNVEKPLEKDESLNIRTSTMVTGIRGTVGYVVVRDRYHSEIALLEGKLLVTSNEPATGGIRTIELNAGQKATVTVTKPEAPTSPVTVTVEPLKEATVPGFVALEVAKSPEIQARIEEKSPLVVPEIIRDADNRLKAEETAATEKAEEVQKQVEEQEKAEPKQEVNQVFTPSAESKPSGGGGSTPTPTPEPTPDPTPTPPPENASLNNPSADQVQDAWSSGSTTVTVEGSFSVTDDFSVPAGKTLTLNGPAVIGSVARAATEATLTTNGSLVVNDTLTVAGNAALVVNGTMELNDSMTVASGGAFTLNGSLSHADESAQSITNAGTMTVAHDAEVVALTNTGALSVEPGSELAVVESMTNTAPGELNVSGDMNVLGDAEFSNSGSVIVATGSTMTVTGAMTNNGGITVDGTMYVAGSLGNESDITIRSGNSLHVSGDLNNYTAGHITAGSEQADKPGLLAVEANGTITNGGDIKLGTDTTYGKLEIKANGTLHQDSGVITVHSNGSIINAGTIRQDSGSITAAGIAITNAQTTGTVTISGGDVSGSGYVIHNAAGGTVTIGQTKAEAPTTITLLNEAGDPQASLINGTFTWQGGKLRVKDIGYFPQGLSLPELVEDGESYMVADYANSARVVTTENFNAATLNRLLAANSGVNLVKLQLTDGQSYTMPITTIPEGKTVELVTGDLTMASLTVNGIFINHNSVIAEGTITIGQNGQVTNGELVDGDRAGASLSAATLSVDGQFINYGEAVVPTIEVTGNGTVDNQENALVITTGSMTVNKTVSNSGTLEAAAIYINESGHVMNMETGTMTVSTTLVVNGVFTNSNALTIGDDGSLYVNSTNVEVGANHHIFNNQPGAIVTNDGDTINNGKFYNTAATNGKEAAKFLNNGSFTNNASGTGFLASEGLFVNAGSFTNNGVVTGSGRFTNGEAILAAPKSEDGTTTPATFINQGDANFTCGQFDVMVATTNDAELTVTDVFNISAAFTNGANGELHIGDEAHVYNEVSVVNNGTIMNMGTFANDTGSSFENGRDGDVVNNGIFSLAESDVEADNGANFENNGTFRNAGDLYIGSAFQNNASFINAAESGHQVHGNGSFHNGSSDVPTAQMTNTGAFSLDGSIYNYGILENSNVLMADSLENNNSVRNSDNARIALTGSLENYGEFRNVGVVVCEGDFLNGEAAPAANEGVSFANTGKTASIECDTFRNNVADTRNNASIVCATSFVSNKGFTNAGTMEPGEFVNNDTFMNMGSLSADTFENKGNFTNQNKTGIVTVELSATHANGSFTNAGQFSSGSLDSNGFFLNNETGVVEVTGSVTNGNNWTLRNSGQFSCASFTNHGTFVNADSFECSGSIQNHEAGNGKDWSSSWALQNTEDGILTCGSINNHASFLNSGTLTCDGDFGNHDQAEQDENGLGAVRNEGTLTIAGIFNNHGPVNNFGTFTMGTEPGCSASFANHAAFRNETGAAFHSYGTFENKNKGSFLNEGSFIVHSAEGTLGLLVEDAKHYVQEVAAVTKDNGLNLNGLGGEIVATLFGNSGSAYVIPISITGTVRLDLNGVRLNKQEDTIASPLTISSGTFLTLVDKSEGKTGYLDSFADSTVYVEAGGTLYYQEGTIMNSNKAGTEVTAAEGGSVEVLVAPEISEDPGYTPDSEG